MTRTTNPETSHPSSARSTTGPATPLRATPTLGLQSLPGRDLSPDELTDLASWIAARPALWEHHLDFSDDERHFVSLHRDAHVDVWLLCWTPVNDTGWHDHDVSAGAVSVPRGTVTEHALVVGDAPHSRDVSAGEVFSFTPDHIHRMVGKERGSVSVHCYSPPLWRMGQYSLGPGGMLRRVSLSYAEELRPLEEGLDARSSSDL